MSFQFRVISRLDSSSSGREEIPTETLSFATFSSLTFRLQTFIGLEGRSITLEMAKGFTLYMVKAIMSGRGDEVIDLARSNLWR